MTSAEPRSFEASVQLARSSWLGRFVIAAADVFAAAARDSRTVAAAAALHGAFLRLPMPARVRAVSTTIAVAAATHLVGRALLPVRMAPAAPVSATLLILGVAFVVTVFAAPIARAARSSRYFGEPLPGPPPSRA